MALCSIAIAAGVLGVVALAKGLFFRRHFRGYRSAFGSPPWALAACGAGSGEDEPRGWGRGRRGWGRRGPGGSFWLRAAFSRLDTTPGQEREIRAAIEEFQRTAHEAKDRFKGVRGDIAKAIASESLDEVALGEANSRVDVASAHVREALTYALKRVHAVLDPMQRERLADLVTNGPGGARRPRTPYRDGSS